MHLAVLFMISRRRNTATLGCLLSKWPGQSLRVFRHYGRPPVAADHPTPKRADSSIISSFFYAYNPYGDITNWVQQLGAVANNWSLDYDAADQLLNVSQTGLGTGSFNESYDPGGQSVERNDQRQNSGPPLVVVQCGQPGNTSIRGSSVTAKRGWNHVDRGS